MATTTTYVSGNGDNPRTLIVVFLRGGADGLNMVAPLQDAGYYKARPRIAIGEKAALRLDDFFGLNPILSGLEPAWKDGALGIVHAVGSEDQTRSHFEAQDLMEHGGEVAGGWLGRFLRYKDQPATSALAAIALGQALPESLRGAPAATALQSLRDFSLGKQSDGLRKGLARLYELQRGLLTHPARDTLNAIDRIEKLNATEYAASHGAEYSYDSFSRGLKQTAQLIKAKVGVEVVSIDLGGWDSHLNQGGIMDPRMRELSRGLNAFYQDMGKAMTHVSVVVMTEFGRRVAENSAFGTDHGRGSAMFVMGGGVTGGKVMGKWPTLKDEVLEGPGDLPVTTNYRDVLAPVLTRHGASDDWSRVFPQFDLQPMQI